MAYADTIRTATATMDDVATLIEGIFVSGYGLTWTAWTPTLGATGSMTWTSTAINFAKYIQCGKLIIFAVVAGGTTGGSASSGLTFTLPVTASATWASNTGLAAANVIDGGSSIAGVCLTTTAVGTVTRYDAGNYGLGAGRTIRVVGAYEAA